MWQTSESWKFDSSSQQLLKGILPVLICDHRVNINFHQNRVSRSVKNVHTHLFAKKSQVA